MRFVVPALLLFAALGCSELRAQSPNRFAAYEHCNFVDGLTLAENIPLPAGVQGRTVKTIIGPRQVPLSGGTRLMYAYPQTDSFANVKVEQIPAKDYAQAKQDLIANFEQILTGDDSSSRNYALKPRLNGLEIYGLDRKQLEGGVLGIYLFFVDRTHTATTIYFLNQEAADRNFSNLSEYAKLRDGFIDTYTRCAAGKPATSAISARASIAPPTEALAAPLPRAPLPDAPLPNAPLPNPSVASESANAAAPAAEITPPSVPKAPARKGTTGAARKASIASARKPAKTPARKSAKPPASKTAKRPTPKSKKK